MYSGNSIQGWMTDEELNWLYETASTMDSIVEIGCWKGKSTHALASGCKGVVFAVDHFKGSPNERNYAHAEAKEKDIFKEYWRDLIKFPNLVVLRMNSHKASTFFKHNSIDMVFIDGSHLYEDFLIDFLSWRPICKKIICGHDRDIEDIRKVFDRLEINPNPEVGTIWSFNLQ